MAQSFDVALKLLFQRESSTVVRALAGKPIARWLDAELPGIRNLRADMIGATADGELIHIEFQSGAAEDLPVRMAQYYTAIYAKFRRHPRQVLVFLGQPKARIPTTFSTPAMKHRYRVLDLKTVSGERYLASAEVGDQILAVLMRLRDRSAAVRRILDSITKLQPDEAVKALDLLLVISGLRGLEVQVEGEIRQMPILNSLLDNKVLGREFKKGLEQGLEKGVKKGIAQGRKEGITEGSSRLLRHLLLRRFKRLPAWAEKRLETATPGQIQQWGERFAEAQTLRQVFDPD